LYKTPTCKMKSSIFKTIVVASILAFSNNIYAQLGIAGGVNLSTLRNGNTILRWDNSPGVGFQIGAFYDIHLSDKFKFQPSLMLLNETYRRSMLVEQGSTDDMKEAFKSFGFLSPWFFHISYR